MLKNVAALASVISFSLMMSGCAETPNEYIELKGKYADDYELDAEDFSEPTRFLYPLKWIEPKRTTNNLDVFYYDVDQNKLKIAGQAATLAIGAIGHVNPLDIGLSLLTQQGAKTTYHSVLGDQYLYTVVKVDKSKDLDAQAQVVNKMAIDTVASVYGDSAKTEYVPTGTNFYLVEGTKVYDPNYVFCKQGVESLCRTFTSRIPMLTRDNDGYIPMAPTGDYMTAVTLLPIGFPIDKLKFIGNPSVEQYLYVPAIKLNENRDLWKQENLAYFKEWYQEERVSVNPYLKRLSDGKVMYFNPKITALQKDDYSLYRVFNLGESEDAQ